MIRRWRLGTPTLIGAVAASCLLLEAIQAQEIKAPTTLVPLPLIKAMANEVSGALAFANVLEIVPYERDRPAEEYGAGTFREAAYMAAKAREYGLSEVRIERFPQTQMEWDGEVGELWVEKPVRRLVTSYRDITATLARGSKSADVTGPLVYVGAGDRESDYAGKAVTGAIVLARGPIGVVHDLAVRKFGAAGVASFHNPVGSPIERPDQIPWTSLTPAAAGAGMPGAQARTTFGFALSLRMGLELLELLDRSGDIVVRARVATREHAAELQVVVGTIPGDGSMEPPDKTELLFSGHLFEGIAKQGANDNAAGPVVQLEMARAWVKLIAEGVLPRPKRTVRFLWVPEFTGTRAYLERYQEVVGRALAAINFDMIGADQSKSKNRLHLSSVPFSLPSFLNDVALQFLDYVAETNREQKSYRRGAPFGLFDPIVDPKGSRDPFLYQFDRFFGASDHVVFIEATPRVPAVGFNTYHDVGYHTSDDSPFFLDPTQMKRSAVIGLSMGHLLANATAADAVAIAGLSAAYGQRRLGTELAVAAMMISTADRDGVHVAYKEGLNLVRWMQWHVRSQVGSAAVMIGRDQAARDRLAALEAAVSAGEPADFARVQAVYLARCAALGVTPNLDVAPTAEETAAARLIPRRTSGSPWAPMPPGSPGASPASLGSAYEMEARSFADGSRTVLDIRNAISAEFGPVALDQVLAFFRGLAGTGTWTLTERPLEKSAADNVRR